MGSLILTNFYKNHIIDNDELQFYAIRGGLETLINDGYVRTRYLTIQGFASLGSGRTGSETLGKIEKIELTGINIYFALLGAIYSQDIKLIEYYKEKFLKNDIITKDILSKVVRTGNVDLVKYFSKYFYKNGKLIANFLEDAIMSENMEMVEYIINHTDKIKNHQHLLSCAARQRNFKIFSHFAYYLFCREEELDIAVRNGNLEIVKYILKKYSLDNEIKNKMIKCAKDNHDDEMIELLNLY